MYVYTYTFIALVYRFSSVLKSTKSVWLETEWEKEMNLCTPTSSPETMNSFFKKMAISKQKID